MANFNLAGESGAGDLVMRLAGFTNADQRMNRNILSDALFADLPGGREVQLEVSVNEIGPLTYTPAHLHNGATIFLILQGQFEAHFADGSVATCKAGDVYSEPVGRVHRGYNPHPTLAFVCVGVAATRPGVPHVTVVETMDNDPMQRS